MNYDKGLSHNIDVSAGTFADCGKGFVSLVEADTKECRRKIDTKTVRRNVSLPSWLNYEVNEADINVSQFLQDALVEKLKIQPRRFKNNLGDARV